MIKSLLLPLMAGLAFYATALSAKNLSLANSKISNSLSFMENKGQITNQHQVSRKDLDFKLSSGNGLNIFIGSGKIEYQWAIASPHSATLHGVRHDVVADGKDEDQNYELYRMDVTLIGANDHAQVIKEMPASYYERYYLPGIPEAGVIARSYQKITYKDIYPSIDWVFYFNTKGQLEHDFVVRPGGKVSDIQIRYGGTTALSVLDDGSLQAIAPLGNIKEHAPYSYDAEGKVVSSQFVLDGDLLSFAVGDYTGTLTIDPTLEWGTYFGGLGSDMAYGLTKASSGNLYMVGIASSADNIATTGSYQQMIGGNTDGFIAKFTPSGSLLWSSYFGGTSADRATDICFDPVNQALYVAGATQSNAGIATTGAHQAVHGGGYDVLLARFDTAGQRIWSTYYGGSSTDGSSLIAGVATDVEGNVFLCSETNSDNNISSPGSHQPARAGSRDGFVTKFNSAGQRLWGTYLGGNSGDFVRKLAFDSKGMLYVGGHTGSSAGIATSGIHQATIAGGNDAFLAKYNTQGVLQWCTYYGGTGAEVFNAIHITATDQVFLGGSTQSTDGIAYANGDQQTNGGIFDGFLACFTAEGLLHWGSYFGGEGSDNISCITSAQDGIFIAGSTASISAIAFNDALQPQYGGGNLDGFLARFDTTGRKTWATYIGATDADDIMGITELNDYEIFLCGRTNSASDMASPNSHQAVFNGGEFDALLMKVNFCDPPGKPAAISGDAAICAGQEYEYITDSIPGAIRYTWQLPQDWKGTSDSNRIRIVPNEESGTITVAAQNHCATGDTFGLSVTVNPMPKPVLRAENHILSTTLSYATYQWLWNSDPIARATDATYIVKEAGQYSARVTDLNGCTGSSEEMDMKGSSIEDAIVPYPIRIYPNPAAQSIDVEAPFSATLVISSMDGRVLIRTSQQNISLKEISPGMYSVQVFDREGRLWKTERLIRE